MYYIYVTTLLFDRMTNPAHELNHVQDLNFYRMHYMPSWCIKSCIS